VVGHFRKGRKAERKKFIPWLANACRRGEGDSTTRHAGSFSLNRGLGKGKPSLDSARNGGLVLKKKGKIVVRFRDG